MRILITGWYGTETIGDRAILANLLRDLFLACPEPRVSISSIYPFFTARTLHEDRSFYTDVMAIPVALVDDIEIVDARKLSQFRREVLSSDLIVIGGGPFDQIAQMGMLEYAFKLAKARSIKTLVYGCGVNPLKNKKFITCFENIIKNADSVILRDQKSLELAERYVRDQGITDQVNVAIDPAVFAALRFAKYKQDYFGDEDAGYIALNLRDYPQIYDTEREGASVNDVALDVLKSMSPDRKIVFVPMHYFATGGDDRAIGCWAKSEQKSKMSVVTDPLNLLQTMDVFARADACIGMRFHSVVFQTVLNGNNYILNYTDSGYGKIPGFIEMIDGIDFYRSRIINLQSGERNELHFSEDSFVINEKLIDQYQNVYTSEINQLVASD